jgi:CMP-N,N'-diacetyllegionaminic acid synthase
MSALFLIPAREGSKGIPGKNYKLLGKKPLIQYSLEVARSLTTDDNICVSSNDDIIIDLISGLGYKVPFKRPDFLSTDASTSYDVIIHAIDHYEKNACRYDQVILLQPTSPFRTTSQVQEAMALYSMDTDMVVSVKETRSNPYYVLMEEDSEGWLQKSKKGNFERRQDAPKVYELNGAIYIMNVNSLKKGTLSSFRHIRKYVMDEISSIDMDTPLDWALAETVMEKELISI